MTQPPVTTPLPANRRSRILAALERDGSVRVSELTVELGVSAMTLRRDLAQYEKEGLLRRVHGGAIAIDGPKPSAPSAPAASEGTIAVLVPSLDYYWADVIRGMEAEAERHGIRLLLRGVTYEVEDERPVLQRLLKDESVLGLIFAPNVFGPHFADVIGWLTTSDLPVVLVERDAVRSDTHTPFESATTDHARGAMLAAHHLAELGHRKVGLVTSRLSPTSRKIAAGWAEACEELGLTKAEHFEQFISDHRSPEFHTTIAAIIDTVITSGTTALLVHSDPEAIGVVEHALARGLTVPDDLSVIAYDDEVAQLYNPALTAISPARAHIGRTAVDLLLRRVNDPARPLHRISLSPQLNVRESTAPPRAHG